MTNKALTAKEMKAHFEIFDRAISQARGTGLVIEKHPETGEPIKVGFIGNEIVLSTELHPAFYRVRLKSAN